MPSFTIKVPNGDEGEDLGVFEADYLPRVGDSFALYHPKLTGDGDHPFLGIVSAVCWEALSKDHKYTRGRNHAVAIVWLVEDAAAVTIYCDCTPEERERWKVEADGRCENCGHVRGKP